MCACVHVFFPRFSSTAPQFLLLWDQELLSSTQNLLPRPACQSRTPTHSLPHYHHPHPRTFVAGRPVYAVAAHTVGAGYSDPGVPAGFGGAGRDVHW